MIDLNHSQPMRKIPMLTKKVRAMKTSEMVEAKEMALQSFIKRNFKHFNAAVLRDAADAYVEHLAKGGKMFLAMAADVRVEKDEVGRARWNEGRASQREREREREKREIRER